MKPLKKHSKLAIVILHGWGLSASRFAPLTSALTKNGYRVFSPDFPGFGQSKMPDRPYCLSDYCDFLHEYLHKRTVSRVVLMGHSFGGRVALKYCDMFKQDVAALILTGTPGVTPVPRKKLFLFIVLAKIGKLFFSFWPLTLVQEKIRLWYYYLVGAREFYRAEGTMRETFKRIVKEDLEPYMERVWAPTLLVWGALDQITPLWIAKKMHEKIKASKLVVIASRDHGVPFKDPDMFVSRIEGFLRSL